LPAVSKKLPDKKIKPPDNNDWSSRKALRLDMHSEYYRACRSLTVIVNKSLSGKA
jgi:hypothetical protein